MIHFQEWLLGLCFVVSVALSYWLPPFQGVRRSLLQTFSWNGLGSIGKTDLCKVACLPSEKHTHGKQKQSVNKPATCNICSSTRASQQPCLLMDAVLKMCQTVLEPPSGSRRILRGCGDQSYRTRRMTYWWQERLPGSVSIYNQLLQLVLVPASL